MSAIEEEVREMKMLLRNLCAPPSQLAQTMPAATHPAPPCQPADPAPPCQPAPRNKRGPKVAGSFAKRLMVRHHHEFVNVPPAGRSTGRTPAFQSISNNPTIQCSPKNGGHCKKEKDKEKEEEKNLEITGEREEVITKKKKEEQIEGREGECCETRQVPANQQGPSQPVELKISINMYHVSWLYHDITISFR